MLIETIKNGLSETPIIKSIYFQKESKTFILKSDEKIACILYYLKKGNGYATIDGGRFFINEKNFIVIQPQSNDVIKFEPECECIFTIIQFEKNDTFDFFPLKDKNSVIVLAEKYNVQKVIEELHDEFENSNPYRVSLLNICIERLIIYLAREINLDEQSCSQYVDSSIVASVKEYIEKNYKDNITLDNLSKKFHVSNSLLSHSFKEKIGISPINYLINIRITKAKMLLASTNHSVLEISDEVGYSNANYFSLLFKKITLDTPSNFRLKTSRKI